MLNSNQTPSTEATPVAPVVATEQPVTPVEDPKVEPIVAPVVETPSEAPKDKEITKTETDATLPEKEVNKSKLAQVSSLVESAGLTMKDVAEIAKANNGDIDLETMVALKEKHGDAIASLLADQIKGIHTERTNAASQRDTEVYDQVKEAFKDISSDPDQTGESMWKELATWSKENVSDDHRTEINTLLAQGGLAAKLAVQELTTAFKEANGTKEFQEAELLEADSTPKESGGTISKQDYNRELNALLSSGHSYGSSSEIAKLDQRRMKSIQRGL